MIKEMMKMNERISKHQALLGVELFQISNEFIFELRKSQKDPHKVFKHLPEFTLNSNEGKKFNHIIFAEDHHQFIGTLKPDKRETYYYFNLKTMDALLLEEISNSGIESLLEDVNFKEILSNFIPQSEKDITNFVFPTINYIVIELAYETTYDYYSSGYECDMDVNVIGYLNNNVIKYLKNEKEI